MDMMDAISHGGTYAGNVPRNAHHKRKSVPLVETTGECTSRTDKGALWMILLDHLMPYHEVVKEVTGNIPRKTRPRRFCPLPPELFLHVCKGHLLIGSIHLQPIWI
jgi:hypothetical protein